jgi:RNA polymerase sigma-70 factor (ECF subfamily)
MNYESLHISELQHRIAAFEDQLAYKDLFHRFQPLLKQFAFSICHSREASEEIVSDVFIRVWAKRKTLDNIQNLRLYLYIATRNVSLNYTRTQQKLQTLQLDALQVDIESVASDPQEMMITADLNKRILQIVNELPTQCKIIFKLLKEDGLKQKEVAELLHLQPKTVENQLAIAIRRIASAISEERSKISRK